MQNIKTSIFIQTIKASMGGVSLVKLCIKTEGDIIGNGHFPARSTLRMYYKFHLFTMAELKHLVARLLKRLTDLAKV